MNKYVFRPYDPKFPKMFENEKEILKILVNKDAKIEHIGSTAVPGLGGKGIIDIIVSVKKDYIEETKKILENNGYIFRPEGGDDERLFFRTCYMEDKNERRIHIHLTQKNSSTWKKLLKVRDYLRKHKKEAMEYSEIKRKASESCKGKDEYVKMKEPFLKRIEKKALKEL